MSIGNINVICVFINVFYGLVCPIIYSWKSGLRMYTILCSMVDVAVLLRLCVVIDFDIHSIFWIRCYATFPSHGMFLGPGRFISRRERPFLRQMNPLHIFSLFQNYPNEYNPPPLTHLRK